VRLYCIPHAGGGAATFRAWSAGLPDEVEQCSVQLPGREDRLKDAPLPSVTPIVAELADVLAPGLDLPYAIFGHSMGALIGFELLRELRRRGAPPAAHLFASAFRAPQLPRRTPAIHELSDDEFVEEVNRRYDAVPQMVRENQELMDLVLPGLRGDISVCDSYEYVEGEPLACPITAFGGEQDEQVGPDELAGWEAQTTGAFALTMFGGEHFFHQTSQAALLAAISAALAGGIRA
jgi:surfactin synthase thioesterase subunit